MSAGDLVALMNQTPALKQKRLGLQLQRVRVKLEKVVKNTAICLMCPTQSVSFSHLACFNLGAALTGCRAAGSSVCVCVV